MAEDIFITAASRNAMCAIQGDLRHLTAPEISGASRMTLETVMMDTLPALAMSLSRIMKPCSDWDQQ